MSCPHSMRSSPCSSCADVPVRVVTIHDGITYVDGIPSGGGTTAAQMPQPKRRYGYGRRRT